MIKTTKNDQKNPTRLELKFLDLKKNNKKAFVPFTVIGDPNLQMSEKIIMQMVESGADMLELGLPFSDPVADGPAIQAADQRALTSQVSLDEIFQLLKKIRSKTNIPISILCYANLPFSFGVELFYAQLQSAGVDAILIADLPLEEATPYLKEAKKNNVHQIFLVHEKTTKQRLQKINQVSGGYLYLVSSNSTTGVKNQLPISLEKTIEFTKKNSHLPVLVGFGIGESSHVKTITQWGADGVIVGSKLVSIVASHLNLPQKMFKALGETIKDLRRGL